MSSKRKDVFPPILVFHPRPSAALQQLGGEGVSLVVVEAVGRVGEHKGQAELYCDLMTSGTHVTFNQWQLMDEVFNLVTAGLDVAQETTAKKSAPAIKDLQYLAAHIEGSKLLEEVELCFLFSLLLMMMPRYLYISNVMTSSPRILLNPHRSTSKKLRIQ